MTTRRKVHGGLYDELEAHLVHCKGTRDVGFGGGCYAYIHDEAREAGLDPKGRKPWLITGETETEWRERAQKGGA